ncbi:MAG: ABC transporter permease [Terriglobia bacterium]
MLLRELSQMGRHSLRRPGPAIVAVASMALAIGFSTAAFSVVDAYNWRDMAVAHPDRLAYGSVLDREGQHDQLTWLEFQAVQQQAGGIAGMLVESRHSPRVNLPDRHDFPITAGVSDNYFDVLGVQAAHGKVFHTNTGTDAEVVISDRYWRNTFAADPSLCGRTIQVNGANLTVIGIAARGFQGTERGVSVDLFVPQQRVYYMACRRGVLPC